MASTNPYGGGGIGGKMRRRPTRSSQSTPYDRPPTTPRTPAAVAPAIDGSNGWLSKIMDPASRLLSGSASKLFSSVFRKSLPAPPQIPASSSSPEGMHQEGEEESVPQLTAAETPAERELAETPVEGDLAEIPDEIKSLSEIEQLLVQKAFTKEQFDHLTELLRARVVEPSLSEPAQIGKEKEAEANIPHREFVAESLRKNVMFATPIPKDEIASPMELAKAYMNSKSSKVSPRTLRLRNSAFVERKPALPNSTVLHASTKPPTGAATPRPGSLLFDQVKDAYPTPRTLGRTAISRMCRSPFVKSGGLSSSGSAAKFSPYDAPMRSTPGSKLALKRGSFALYDEIGSVGPIRRIRQKLNMTTPSKESAPSPYKNFAPTHATALKIDSNHDHASASTQKHFQLTKLNQGKDESTCEDGVGDAETEPENIRIPHVPLRSTETAMKILNQLEKIVQSPKDKRSQNTVLEIEASTSQNHDKLKVDLPKLTGYDEKISFQGNGVGMIGSVTGTKTNKSVPDGTSSSVAVPKLTKPAFRMSVSEEFLDDDDEEANGKKIEVTVPVKNVFHKVESGTSMQRNVESKIPEEKATTASEVKSEPARNSKPDEIILSAAPETNDALKFTSPITPPIKFDFPSVAVSPTASLDVFVKKDEKYPSPIFSSGSKQLEKPETPVFSWASEKIGAKTDPRLPATEALDSDRNAQKRKSEDTDKLTESSAFSTSSSLATQTQVPVKPVFSFGGSASPDLSNGSAHSSPTFSFPDVPAATSATQTAVASSTAAFSIMANANDSSAAVQIPKASFVQFGVSNSASLQTLASPLLDDPSAKASDTSTFKPVAFGSSCNFSTASATAPSTLTTSTITTGLFSSNVAGESTSVTLNTPTFAFGNSEKATTSSAPTFAFGSSAITAAATTSSPSGALVTSAETAPASTSTTTTSTTTVPTVTFGSSGSTGSFTFSASSQPADSSSQAAPFAFGAAASSSNSGTSIFGFGASSQNTSSSTSMPSSGSSQSTFGFGASSGSVFGTKPAQPASTGTQSFLLQSQSSSSQFSSPFSSAASSPVVFGASSGGFSFPSTASSSGSTLASTSQSSMFGSGSSGTPSIFGASTFGSNASGSTFTLGQSSSTLSTSLAFGAQSSSLGFSFTASSNSSTAPSFGLSNPDTNSSTLFGSVSPGSNNDQMSMEDSMVDDTNQVATANPTVPVFGQAASPIPLFGAPSSSTPAPAFQFGAQPSQSLFQPGSNLEFNAGNQVSGSGASDKANRRYVKVRRDKMRKR